MFFVAVWLKIAGKDVLIDFQFSWQWVEIVFKPKVCDGFGIAWCEESSFGARAEAAEVLNVVKLEFVCIDAADACAENAG